MSKIDIYLALLALACSVFTYAAFAGEQPRKVALIPLGLAILVLAFFLKSAGWL